MLHRSHSRGYPSQCRSAKQQPSQGDRADRRLLDQAIVRYQQAERLAERAAQYKQQAAWLEGEAKEQEQWANHLVWVVANRERVQAREAAQVEEWDRRKEANRQRVRQRAAEEEAAAEAAVAAEEAVARQERNWRKPHKPQRKVRFRLPTVH